METSKYNQIAESLKPKKTVLKHCIYAFVYGGAIGAIGQFFLELYMNIFEIDQQEATPMMIITIVLIAAILTGLGIYDRLGKKAGAGTFIPITGFANSMTSSALEAKSEGLVTGIGANMFKLGGTVITFGIVASFVLGGIRYVISLIW
ncbi:MULTISPECIES: stage V sporulation protein AC [unclassified Thomasclavelia]|uniref:stage V sporulation protein AC n=1 Tax=unclassified Thomasclavelia TaxID=3025756 RepID=UPI000B377B6F|nr:MULTISPECIES: stage V sporulation protein AC [unclassified Thomasclavelia]OUP74590.1 stage V sporulation protein AC [Erysipelatoclostridium sp. An173]OUQ08637.1 stage V sporulation protein AC [Erysipelatoclostridium sp. An15]